MGIGDSIKPENMWARFSKRTFNSNPQTDGKCAVTIDKLVRYNHNVSKDSARQRYERVGASIISRTYNHPLLQSVEDQAYERCKSLIDGGVDVNMRDHETGCSPLHLAARQENYNILKILLENGADCNTQDDTEQSPLHIAVKKDKIHNAQILLASKDLNVNIQNKTHDTPLHVAVKEGRYEICKLIMQHSNLKVNSRNKKGMTPLHCSVQENHLGILKLLIENGASWKIKDIFSFMPLHYAAQKGFPECCDALVSCVTEVEKEKQLKACLKDGKTPLMLASKNGHHRCCRLMECGNVNAKDKDGNTALHHAVTNSFEGTLLALLDMGANPNTCNKNGIAPILEAASKKKVGCLKALHEKETDFNVFDHQNRCVLHYAAEKNSFETLTYILDSVDIENILDQKDYNQCTPLHVAIKKGSVECATLLLAKGASPVIECAGGMTPLHLAADKGYTSLCEALLSKKLIDVSKENENKATPLHIAAMHDSPDVCQMLIRKGARTTAMDSKGRTALHVASAEGAAKVVKLLSKKGIPLKAKDDAGSCPLHLAASRGSLDCCKILVNCAKGASWEIDQNGKLPLDRAFKNLGEEKQKMVIECHDQVFKYLLENLNYREKANDLMLRIHKYMDIAILENRVTIIEAIVNSSWWHAGISGEAGHQCPNFRHLIESHPQLALQLMDKCVKPAGDRKSKEFDFRLLEDSHYILKDSSIRAENPFDEKSHKLRSDAVSYAKDSLEWKENHPLTLMISHQHLKMLYHPLIKMWMLYKWKSYTNFIFITSLIIEALFTICFTIFMGFIDNWANVTLNCNFSKSEFCDIDFDLNHPKLNCTFVHNFMGEPQEDHNKSMQYLLEQYDNNVSLKFTLWHILLFLTLVIIGKESYIFWRLGKQYVWYIEHKIRMIRLFFTIPVFIYFGGCEFNNVILNDVNWQLGIIGLLSTWLHFINSLNQLPLLSVFMPVTNKFVNSFFKVLMYLVLIVFVFAFIFYLLLSNQKSFETIPDAMVKTSAWMLQDLAYDNTFVLSSDAPMYPELTKFLFLTFVAFLGGFIINFIITQPSNHLETFKMQARFHRAANRAELLFKFDVCFPFLRNSMAKSKIVIDDTEKNRYMRSILMLDEESKPETQLDVLQEELEKQTHQISHLVSLLTKQTEEMYDLKQQVNLISKSLPQ